jgi:DNA-binding NarL/FixJ family response regulator
MKGKKVLIACEHGLFATSLKLNLEQRYEVVGGIQDGLKAVEQALKIRPDCVLVGVNLSLFNGPEVVRLIRCLLPFTQIVLIGKNANSHVVSEAFQEGIAAYVSTREDISILISAIDDALHGKRYVSPEIAHSVEDLLKTNRRKQNEGELSALDSQVVRLLAEGRSLKEVSSELGMTLGTVAYHKYRAMKKLGLKTNPELYKYITDTEIKCTIDQSHEIFIEEKKQNLESGAAADCPHPRELSRDIDFVNGFNELMRLARENHEILRSNFPYDTLACARMRKNVIVN